MGVTPGDDGQAGGVRSFSDWDLNVHFSPGQQRDSYAEILRRAGKHIP